MFKLKAFWIKLIGDANLRPLVDVAIKQVQDDREGKVGYYLANGVPREFDAVLVVCDFAQDPSTPKPWRRVQLKRNGSRKIIPRLVRAIKEIINEADGNL